MTRNPYTNTRALWRTLTPHGEERFSGFVYVDGIQMRRLVRVNQRKKGGHDRHDLIVVSNISEVRRVEAQLWEII